MVWARRQSTSFRTLAALGVVFLSVMALFGGRASIAQAQDAAAHPAHIHVGTCDELDPNPAFPLSNVSGEFLNGETATAGDEVGAGEESLTVEGSTTTVEVSLDELLASNYAINVHESAENAANYIACGNVSGVMTGEFLVIGLAEQNDSGYSGVAFLTPSGATTTVSIYLTSPYVEEEATPEADTEEESADTDSEEAAGGEEAIAIEGFAFGPADITIPVGTTVTWTNNDGAPHTATADDGSFDSGNLSTGDSFSFTFDTPGTYTYHCNVHPNMTATITVE
jgi:plastocyanin